MDMVLSVVVVVVVVSGSWVVVVNLDEREKLGRAFGVKMLLVVDTMGEKLLLLLLLLDGVGMNLDDNPNERTVDVETGANVVDRTGARVVSTDGITVVKGGSSSKSSA